MASRPDRFVTDWRLAQAELDGIFDGVAPAAYVAFADCFTLSDAGRISSAAKAARAWRLRWRRCVSCISVCLRTSSAR